MKQIFIKKGQAVVQEVPVPQISKDEILVEVSYSCLSVGTEMSSVRSTGVPIWKRALKQPEQVKAVFELLSSKGLDQTLKIIETQKEKSYPTGYSVSGIVKEVGSDVVDIKIGDSVACAGANYAYHAEYIRVPRNLCVPVSGEMDKKAASSVTLGAIALQGVRRANPTLGETFVVVGLGILGQLTVQLLKINGCQVIGIDLDQARINLAEKDGMDVGIDSHEDSTVLVNRLTNGYGADGVIITAASPSDEIISTSFQMCRKKGRVVLVGDVGLNLNREDFYKKEIDFLISTSYGPGRYNKKYEEDGLDYPIEYVRWTENRNMQAYLRLIGEGKIHLDHLISSVYDVDDAEIAYSSIQKSDPRPLMVLIKYNQADESFTHKITTQFSPQKITGKIRMGIIGVGSFVTGTHLPNLAGLSSDFEISALASRSGSNLKDLASLYKTNYITTNEDDIINDPSIDAVIIATRHDSHADLAYRALAAGKHVLLEKPIGITTDEVQKIQDLVDTKNNTLPILLTGYNRRFSPFAKRIKNILNNKTAPFIMNYRMNAGYVPEDHWVHGKEGGGRNIGEACHIYDLFIYFADCNKFTVQATSIETDNLAYKKNDNFISTVKFENGCVCNLIYTSQGNSSYPKESAEIFSDNKIIELTDYRSLVVHGASTYNYKTKHQQKGWQDELMVFSNAIKSGEWPISWVDQRTSFDISIQTEIMIHNS